jgi:hypothetical protein
MYTRNPASRWRHTRAVLAACALATGLAPVPRVHAQPAGADREEGRYTFALVGVPLGEALHLLIDRTRIDLFYEQTLVESEIVFCDVKQATREAVLRCILEETSLDFYRLSSGVYVLTRKALTAPAYGALAGIVLDTQTLEPLSDVAVILHDLATGAATNLAGRFAFSRLKPGRYVLALSHVAYQNQAAEVDVGPGATAQLRILLQPKTLISAPIVVNGLTPRLTSARLNREDMELDASAASAPLDGLATIIGVHVGDALADVHVQGGEAGEHQYTLDGAPVFMPLRNGGFFGSFSPFAIERIDVHKAGYEARYGSVLAGTIEMKHDLASAGPTLIVVQGDPLSVNGRFDGPEVAWRGARIDWMVAGRRSLWDIVQPRALEARLRDWGEPNPYLWHALFSDSLALPAEDTVSAASPLSIGFSDLHAASRVRFGNGHSIQASLYSGFNRYGYDAPANVPAPGTRDMYSWVNLAARIRYDWVAGRRTFMHADFTRSEYRLHHPIDRRPFARPGEALPDSLEPDADDFNDLFTYSVGVGIDHALTDRHFLAGAVEAVYVESEFSLSTDPSGAWPAITHSLVRPARFRWQAFLEDTWALSERSTLTLGIRQTYLHAQRRLYAEPRLALRLDTPDGPGGIWAFRLAAGLYRQFVNQFDVASYNPSALLPSFRFWIPISASMRAPTAYHTAASMLFKPSDPWQIRLESYYKYHPRLTVLDYTARMARVPDRPSPADVFDESRGYGYGFGVEIVRERASLVVTARYDFAAARRRTAHRFGGRSLPVPWDVPHQAYAAIDYRWGASFTASARWIGIFGRMWGYRRAYYDYLEPGLAPFSDPLVDFSRPDLHRLPAFSEVDLGLAYAQRLGRLGLQGRLNVVNLLGRRNVLEWTLREGISPSAPERRARYAPPFYPSISIRVQY